MFLSSICMPTTSLILCLCYFVLPVIASFVKSTAFKYCGGALRFPQTANPNKRIDYKVMKTHQFVNRVITLESMDICAYNILFCS